MARWEALAVRALGSVETELTVLAKQQIAPAYLRIEVEDGGLLARRAPFPTMWLRLWFTRDGRDHQRAFTLVDPDPETGRFALEFALHEGAACDWARACRPGDRISASLLGAKQPWAPGRRHRAGAGTAELGADLPDGARTVLVGDSAALPALNSLLAELTGQEGVEIWLEHRDLADAALPVRAAAGHELHRIRRTGSGGAPAALAEHWTARPPGPADRVWIALEAADTRALVRTLRTDHRLPEERICATAYWRHA